MQKEKVSCQCLQKDSSKNLFDEADVILGREKMTDLLNENLQLEWKESEKAKKVAGQHRKIHGHVLCVPLCKRHAHFPHSCHFGKHQKSTNQEKSHSKTKGGKLSHALPDDKGKEMN